MALQVDKFLFIGLSLGSSVALLLCVVFEGGGGGGAGANKIEALCFNVPAPTMKYVITFNT